MVAEPKSISRNMVQELSWADGGGSKTGVVVDGNGVGRELLEHTLSQPSMKASKLPMVVSVMCCEMSVWATGNEVSTKGVEVGISSETVLGMLGILEHGMGVSDLSVARMGVHCNEAVKVVVAWLRAPCWCKAV